MDERAPLRVVAAEELFLEREEVFEPVFFDLDLPDADVFALGFRPEEPFPLEELLSDEIFSPSVVSSCR